MQNFESFQKAGKENVDLALKSFGTLSRNFQTIAAEMADYSKRSFETGTAALERMYGAKSLDKAFEIQSDYIKTAYEGFVAQATKIGELCTDMAKETYKPFENVVAKAGMK